jgi:tetratricopeptide (TPR) repeat protein
MKRLILAVVSVGMIGGAMLYLNRHKAAPVPPAEPTVEAAPSRTMENPQSVKAAVMQQKQPRVSATAADSSQTPPASPALNEVKPDNSTNSAASTAFSQAIDILVSPQASFQQKQAAWKRLRDAGELDQAIAALKQGAASNPTSPEYPTALGEAYVYQLQTVRDYHETSILGLKADQSFDAALKLDPSNWEAQFFKTASLSHWPPEMNKGPEVIQRLSSLIDQQEAMPPQPQFAQTYVLLGEQYQQAGKPDYAVQTWKLGAARFPGDATLRKKISGSP